ncbi:MAG: T9SS type A sorting domain-containing protein [Chitinophagales bacterium]|nr:T9SS type A sorting domain-containing protein [Chitinophagales bacterium]
MMRYIPIILLSFFLMLGLVVHLQGQGFERNLYDIQSADLITEVEGDTFLINSSLNQFHLIGKHGEVLEDILHTNNQHPDDVYVGETLVDMHPYPLPNGDIAFFARKTIDTSLAKSDVLYFNYREGSSKTFTVQKTLFLPESLAEINESGYTRLVDYTFLNDHFYFAGLFHTTVGDIYPVLMKISLTGELLWSKTYLLSYSANGEISRIKAIDTIGSNRILLALEYADFEYYHLEIDEDGGQAGGSYFPLTDELSILEDASKIAYWIQADGGLIIAGRSIDAGDDDLFVFDANADLVFARPWFLGVVDVTEYYRVIRQVEGGFIVYRQDWVPAGPNRESLTISKVDLAGDLIWQKTYVPSNVPAIKDIKVLSSGNIVFGGLQTTFIYSPDPNDIYTDFGYLLKLGPNGDLYGSIFKGQTFEDIDPDCSQLVEAPLGGWLVAYESPTDTFYALSNAMGAYERPVLPDTYEASLYPPSEYWSACPPVGGLEILYEDTLTHHFPAAAIEDCPNLIVNTSAPFLRRCFESTYTVNYCNTGTVLAEDAYIEVELDAALSFIAATLLPSSIQGQLLRFDVGSIDVGQCGDFQITVLVGCDDVLLGQTHCTTASIYPNEPCTTSADWSGASLEVDARCEGDSVAFVIKNVGNNTTSETVRYLVIEDQVILSETEGGTLPAQDSIRLTYPATGAFYRIEVEQEPNHPGNSFPTASVEGCTSDPGAAVSLGFHTQYWEDDADHFISIDCQQNIGSYDPNDKRAFPGGITIGNKNYIESNQTINYHIRFQNTGTDTAFTVIIKDPVDPNLDLTSLKLEAASHDYSLEITPLRELVFTFDEINLVDSFANEPLSHGFVSFSLEQIPDLPEGTQIENEAAIFFDYNLPIYTNTWVHEIKENILPYAPIVEPPVSSTEPMKIGPNPMGEMAQIEVPGVAPEDEVQLRIYDSRGVLCRRSSYQSNAFIFHRNNLADGIYFIEALSGAKSVKRAKLIIQTP